MCVCTNINIYISFYFQKYIITFFKSISHKNPVKSIFIFILGTLEPLEKKVLVRKKPEQRVAQQAAMVVPEKVVQAVNIKDEDSVERTVRKIRKLIVTYYKETQKPLDFFKLILHPQDFGRTVRNMLYISFLVKDGIVTVRKGILFSLLLRNLLE